MWGCQGCGSSSSVSHFPVVSAFDNTGRQYGTVFLKCNVSLKASWILECSLTASRGSGAGALDLAGGAVRFFRTGEHSKSRS